MCACTWSVALWKDVVDCFHTQIIFPFDNCLVASPTSAKFLRTLSALTIRHPLCSKHFVI